MPALVLLNVLERDFDMNKCIVIMAGGTGGHVFPALAVAEALIEKGWQVSWLGTQKGLESRVIPEHGIDIDWLSVAGVRGKGWLGKVTATLLLAKASLQAVKILRQRKPDVVLGMGGFVAGPGGLMAKLLGIPLIIHEQNRVPGTTNRLLARLANQVLEAFPGSFNKKIDAKFTGNPLRKEFLIPPSPAFSKRERTFPFEKGGSRGINILIVGGSQGAQILNEVVPEAIGVWEQNNSNALKIKHQTGAVMQEQVMSHYKALGISAEVSAFIEDMMSAYQWANLIICRAGAMTISEVAAAGVPAIYIPLPSAIDDHQTANARYLTDAGAGLLLMQKDLNKTMLAEYITKLIGQLEVMSKVAKEYARLDATEVVAGICIDEAGK
jgi:UDP-N-acetylglucosamine--N-acetylmuramyl-(pentapeptide) pyrophosphoryl-undecaprenol N-acetylglucosamine transferase